MPKPEVHHPSTSLVARDYLHATSPYLGANDLIRLDADWLSSAKGSQGGGTTTLGSYTPTPYIAGGDSSNFNIKIEFKGTWTSELYNGFVEAADVLCKYITGDVQDVLYRGKIIDDIVITAELKAIDGTGGILGQAGPTALRTGTYLPALASMQFDSADAQFYRTKGLWNDIVFHEMAHSLGFGSIWSNLGLVQGNAFIGEQAEKLNNGYPVPVETDGGAGTAGSHWDEETFGSELMTGYINETNNISDMTWASLDDIGYDLTPGYQTMPDYLLS